MKYWHSLLMYFGAFLLQPVLYSFAPQLGITPNLILCLTVVLVLLYDDNYYGIFNGAIFGLLSDVCYGQYFGINSLAFVIIAIIVLFLREFANVENVFTAVITGAVSTWLHVSIVWLIMKLAGSPYDYMMAIEILPLSIIFNEVIIVILYFILIKRVIKFRRDRYFK
ncbi:MAG: rod shape-determining protein MreD [Eubacteriales bacterium]|nr:rod shape-determining protein MreD [Eubacteriales bacterium]